MRQYFRQLLAGLTKLILSKHRPEVIAVTGAGANGVARELIFQAINIRYPAVQSLEAPIAEFSIPLTVFGASGYPQNWWQWVKVIVKAVLLWIKLPSYKHFMIVEVDTIDKAVTDFWLKVLKPAEVVRTEAVNNPDLDSYKQLALEVASRFDVDSEIAAGILEFYEPEHARISFQAGVNGGLVVDATYHFYPADLELVAEAIEIADGANVLVLNPSKQDLALADAYTDWNFADSVDVEQIGRKSTIILRGFAPVARRKFKHIFAVS